MSIYVKTPLKPLTRINERTGKNFQIKMECLQPDGSFKLRGVSLLCEHLKAQGVKKLVSASGGNAGHATAYCARELGMDCTVVVPGSPTSYMADVIRREGATVEGVGRIFDDAKERALEIVASDPEAYFVHPFDHPLLWKGHSTIVDELVEQTEKPDAIVLSVGGGGLFNGVIEGLDRNGWGDIPVIAVEVEGAPKFHKALEAGHPVDLEKIGPMFENAKIFPDRTNTEFVRVVNTNTLKMRCYERGSGETLACGSGACAAVVAAVENGFCAKDVDITVQVKGGALVVRYTDDGVFLTGNASLVYTGKMEY